MSAILVLILPRVDALVHYTMTGRPRRSVARPVSYAKIDAGSDIGDDEDDPHLKELERQETTEDDESEDEFKMDVDEEHGEEEEEDDDDDDEQADTDDASNSRSSMEPDETPVPLKNENGDLAWGSPASKRYKMRPISAKIAARPPPKLHQPPSQKFHRAVRDLIDDLNHPNYEEVELDAAWGGIHAGPVLQFQRNMGWKFTEQNNDLYPSFMSIDDLTLVDANQAVKHMPPEGTVKIMTGPPGLATRTELQNYSTYDLCECKNENVRCLWYSLRVPKIRKHYIQCWYLDLGSRLVFVSIDQIIRQSKTILCPWRIRETSCTQSTRAEGSQS